MEDVLKQAKKKALSLLECMDRTEEQLRLKLKQKGYADEVVEQAILYVKSFGYVNDANYAERFILNRQKSKSKRELYAALCQKGIDAEMVGQAMEHCYEEYSEVQTIRNLLERKYGSWNICTEDEKRKIYQYFLRKGFRNEDIRQVIQVSSWNA